MIVVRAPWSNSYYLKILNRVHAKSQPVIVKVGLVVSVGCWLSQLALTDSPWPVVTGGVSPFQEPFLIQKSLTIYVILMAYVALLLKTGKLHACLPTAPGFASLFQSAGSRRAIFDQPHLACSVPADQPVASSAGELADESVVRPTLSSLHNSPNLEQRRLPESSEPHGSSGQGAEPQPVLSLEELLTSLCQQLVEASSADACLVMHFDETTGVLKQHRLCLKPDPNKISDNDPISDLGSISLPLVEYPRLETQLKLRLSFAVRMSEADLDPSDAKLLGALRCGSLVAVPLTSGDQVTALLMLLAAEPQTFTNAEIQLAELLVHQANSAAENARLYSVANRQLQSRVDELTRLQGVSNQLNSSLDLGEILGLVLQEALAVTRADAGNVYSYNDTNGDLVEYRDHAWQKAVNFLSGSAEPDIESALPVNAQIIGRALRSGKAILISDVSRDRDSEQLDGRTGSEVVVPIHNGGGPVGVVSLESSQPHFFNPDQLPYLVTLASHAAIAIENAYLFGREEQRRQVADTLRSVAEMISSQLEFEELLNIVLQELALVVDYDGANVQLLQDDKLIIIGGRGGEDGGKVLGLSFPMDRQNPNHLVIETQEAVIINDTQAEYPASFGPPLHHRVRSWLGIPLTYGTHILGLMALDKFQPNFFKPEDAEIVSAFANQVAVALQNARLFEEARQQVRQLAILTEVAQSINRASQLNDVLNLVLDAVFDLVEHRKGSIWLIDSSTDTVKIANTQNISNVLVELFNESHISVSSEPFASIIQSGKVLTKAGSAGEDHIANYGLPFPDDVTYVPLKTEEGVIGILAIEAIIRDTNMLEMVTTLADLAAVAIDSARLLEDTRRRATEMRHLYKLGVEVSGTLDVRQVMYSVITRALRLSKSHVGAILFWDEETSQYLIEGAAVTDELAAQFGLSQADWLETKFTKQNPLSLWSDLIRQIVTDNQPIVASLTEVDPNRAGEDRSDEKLGRAERVAKRLGVQAILGVPIPIQYEIHGAIFVSSLTPRNYDSRDVQSLSLAANQASVAVRNAQLVQRLNLLTEELEQRVTLRTEELAKTLQDLTEERDRVEVLYEIGRELSTSFDLDRVLTEALYIINRAIGISLGSILLLDPETGRLAYRAALGRDIPLPRGGLQTKYSLANGLAGSVMETREPRLVRDLRRDPDWVPTDEVDDRRSAIVVPLTTGDEMLGALMLFHPEPDFFSEDQLKLVSAAGAQIAIAINNAELYRLITDQAERLGVMYRQQAAEAAKNQAILQGITDGVLVLDEERYIALVNPKAAEILNINASEVEGQPLQQILGRSGSPVELELSQLFYDNLLTSLAEIEAGARSAQFRIEVRPKVVTISLAPVAFGSRELPSIVALLRDISREAEVERLKNEFISTVSHELRTPMTSIKGYADLLLSDRANVGDLNQTQSRFVSIIQSNANRLTDLVNDILEISRIETGRIKLKFTSLNFVELIKEVAEAFEAQMAEKSLTFSLHLPDSLPNVYADKARLTQILVNLIGNAWQYTPEAGRIEIDVKVAGNVVQVDVTDSGIGIVEQDVPYIFDRFFRSERTEVQVVDGTGLGLSITKSFVEMLGGQIWVKSEIDAGSTFSFTSPLDVSGEDGPVGVTEPVESASEAHLIVISDDAGVYTLLNSDLQGQGHKLVVLNNGQKALDLARRASVNTSLILLDIALRDADSLVLLEQFRQDEITKNIPVILSLLSTDECDRCLIWRPVDHIDPTAGDIQILDRIKFALGGSDAAGLQPGLSASSSSGQLLLVEKNRTTSARLKSLLSGAGYEVHSAFNARQGLDMAVGNKPELILISAKMSSIDGQTVFSRLQFDADTKGIPVMLIVDDPTAFQAYQGADDLSSERFEAGRSRPIPVDRLITELLQIETTGKSA